MTAPLVITTTPKSSIFEITRKAMNNADINNKIVSLQFAGSSALVYPNDNQTLLMLHLKSMDLMQRIQFSRKK